MKRIGNSTDGSKSMTSLILAKIIALSVCFILVILAVSEIFAFGGYALPLLLTYLANNVGVTKGADWVIGGILWAFPSLFVTIILSLLHFYFWKMIFVKVWRWMIVIMKKRKPE